MNLPNFLYMHGTTSLQIWTIILHTCRDIRNNIFSAVLSRDFSSITASLKQIPWSSEGVESLQNSVLNGPYIDACVPKNFSLVC